jgi:hypothetical protein
MKSILQTIFGHQPQEAAAAPPLVREESFAAVPAGTAAALQGDIAAIALENIFQFLDLAALTGRLDIRSPTNSGSFYFRNGALTHGVLRVSQRRIGEILLESNLITTDQLQECLRLREQARPPRRFGQILLDQRHTPPAKLDGSLLQQMKEAFFETLSWHEGSFAFYPELVPAPEEMQTRARIDSLLLEGMMHLDEAAD